MAHRLGFQTPSIESRKAGMLDALFNAALCRFGIIDVVNYGRVVIHVIDQLALPLAIDDWDYRQTCCQTQSIFKMHIGPVVRQVRDADIGIANPFCYSVANALIAWPAVQEMPYFEAKLLLHYGPNDCFENKFRSGRVDRTH